MSLVQSIAPVEEPVSASEAKTQCNVYFSEDDAFISALIVAARERTEANTWRQLCTATYVLRLRGFPGEDFIDLPRPPTQAVSGITYIDTDGATQTLSTDVWELDAFDTPGRVRLKYGKTWPTTRDQWNAVTITYTAGYSDDGNAVPQVLKQAILMRVANWYLYREPTVPLTIQKVFEGPEALDAQLKFRHEFNFVRARLGSI